MEKLQRMNQQRKLAQWEKRVADCRGSGLLVKDWCNANGVSVFSYYKWQKRLFEKLVEEQPQFVEVTVPQQSSSMAVLRLNDATLEIPNGIDEKTITAIIRVLRSC